MRPSKSHCRRQQLACRETTQGGPPPPTANGAVPVATRYRTCARTAPQQRIGGATSRVSATLHGFLRETKVHQGSPGEQQQRGAEASLEDPLFSSRRTMAAGCRWRHSADLVLSPIPRTAESAVGEGQAAVKSGVNGGQGAQQLVDLSAIHQLRLPPVLPLPPLYLSLLRRGTLATE